MQILKVLTSITEKIIEDIENVQNPIKTFYSEKIKKEKYYDKKL